QHREERRKAKVLPQCLFLNAFSAFDGVHTLNDLPQGVAVCSSSFRSLKTDGTQMAEVVVHCGAAVKYHFPHKGLYNKYL
ncbi:MAG: hypothetical protein V7695_03260, partial [Sulfitobacter sp.]